MALSTFAFILGILELVIGLPLLLVPARAGDWMIKLTKEQFLYRFIWFLGVVLCALPLLDNPFVEPTLAGLVRLVAWLGLAKSLVFCWWPSWNAWMVARLLSAKHVGRLLGAIAVGFGAFMFWAGAVLK